MLVLDENNGQRKRVTTCEYCWTVVLTTQSPAALVECADCARVRLEPPDERLYDWRDEYEQVAIRPIERALDAVEERMRRANTR